MDGWFLAREANGKVTFAPVAAGTGETLQMHDLPGGAVLIGAEGGLFLARAVSGNVTIERTGETGYVLLLHDLPGGGVLIGTAAGWFVAREAEGKVTLTPAGHITIGGVIPNARDPGYQMRDLPGGAVLIGAERGVFVAGPVSGGSPGCERP